MSHLRMKTLCLLCSRALFWNNEYVEAQKERRQLGSEFAKNRGQHYFICRIIELIISARRSNSEDENPLLESP